MQDININIAAKTFQAAVEVTNAELKLLSEGRFSFARRLTIPVECDKSLEVLFMDFSDSSTFSTASGKDYHYVVLQVTLKEKFLGTGSGNLTELEEAINHQAQKGYRLHTITTSNGGSKGLMGGDRIQATMVFEKVI